MLECFFRIFTKHSLAAFLFSYYSAIVDKSSSYVFALTSPLLSDTPCPTQILSMLRALSGASSSFHVSASVLFSAPLVGPGCAPSVWAWFDEAAHGLLTSLMYWSFDASLSCPRLAFFSCLRRLLVLAVRPPVLPASPSLSYFLSLLLLHLLFVICCLF